MDLVHYEAPEPRRGAPAHNVALAALRELSNRPGTWGRVATYGSTSSATAFVSRLRKRMGADSASEFEFTTRSREDGSADVFAIYLGTRQ